MKAFALRPLLLGLALPLPLQAHTLAPEGRSSDKEALRQHILEEFIQSAASPKCIKLKPQENPVPRTLQKPAQIAATSGFDLSSLLSVQSFVAPSGNGALMAASFAPFKPKVRFYWDNNTFYEESDNQPDNMPNKMVGITSWQQQIPIPAAYFASVTNPENSSGSLGFGQPNYWRLPLVPTVAASPTLIFTPGQTGNNFQRGAIALASNGIAIFNPANNTGRVSYEIGELDVYGGHCGLADDYHYHIVPMHLSSRFGGPLGDDKPVAWALDGYPIYGYVEPDGTAMQALDSNGGHDIGNGWGYHYHARGTNVVDALHPYGTPQSPYTMTSFRGTVVNFGGQVDGQPEVGSIRASGTGGYTAQPVSGASFGANAYKNPVALTTDGSGHLIEDTTPGAVASPDSYRLRVTISGTDYDECWKINRNVNPRTLTVTWRLAGATTTTTYTPNASTAAGARLAAYTMNGWSESALPDTSQVLNTTATFGEDSDYSINAQSFTDNGNGTITDNITGLMWQKVDAGEMTWDNAVLTAPSQTTGGFSDWRLPTPAELFSIFNHNVANPALNTTYFPNNPNGTAEYWWSSDIFGSSTTNVWCTNAGGGVGPKPKSETVSAGGSLRYHARYVRGAKPTNLHSYTNNGDGTITDTDTGLMWTQLPAAATTWEGALAYSEGLALGGYSDWRLPNVKELQTLVDYPLATATTTANIKPCLNRTLFAKTLTNCTTTTSSGLITCDDTTGLLVGMPVVDPSSITGTYISNTTVPTITQVNSATSFTISATPALTGSGLKLRALASPTAYWTSTSQNNNTANAWVVDFGITSSSNPPRNSQGIISQDVKTASYPVMAVRTPTLSTQIAVSQNGTALTDGVSTVSYGNVNVGSTSTKTLVINNTGSTSLSITGVTIDGANAVNFTVTASPASTIAAGGSTTLDVQFNASSAGNKVAALHIANSDTSVGSSFDITLSGTGFVPAPTITNIATTPTVPSNVDTPTVSATITPASGATITSATLTYSTGAQTTATIFNEPMATTATATGGWDGTGATYPWTVNSLDGAGNIKQTAGTSNHTTGITGSCGVVLGKGSASSTDPTRTMITTTNPINATGTFTSGSTTTNYVEFWVRTVGLTGTNGWTFQLAPNGTTFTERVAEFSGSVHGFQLYHYDLQAGDLTSTLKMRFGFVGNGVGGPTGSSVTVDDIVVVTTSGSPPSSVAMTGPSSGGTFSATIPAQVSGTTITYSIAATDSNGQTTTITNAGSYTTGVAPTITSNAALPNATPNIAYSITLAATSGAGGNVWNVLSGALPSGITLSSTGLLSGTTTAQGVFNFIIKVTDSVGRIGTKAFTLTITTLTAPNIVIILTDDQGWGDVSYHTPSGQVPVQTPNMARIGTEGIRLEKFYATPVCATSRCSLLTGRSTIRTNSGNQRGVDPSEHMMPQTFKAAGYQTFMCGKWHLGGWGNNIYTTTLNGITITAQHEGIEFHPLSRGWDTHYGQYGGAIGYFTHTSSDPGLNNRLDWWLNGVSIVETTDLQGNSGYSTDLLADKAVTQIVNRNKAQPMLLYLAFNGVHAGVQAPQSYITKYQNLGVTDSSRRTLCAAVDCMDVAMGRVLDALDSEGITNNTIVVYMSDNGGNEPTGSFNDPLRGTKNDSYDGGIHTPAAIRWPGVIPAGITSNQYVWIGDIFPTLCSAVGVTPQNTKPFDGLNLWPTLQSITSGNPDGTVRPSALVTGSATPVALNTFTDPVSGSTKMFKLIRTKGPPVVNELFNMTDDPYEANDLAANAAYASIITTLTTSIASITAENYAPYIGPPVITQNVQQGETITLYAAFTSYGKTPSVQWRRNGVNLSGATSYFQLTNGGTAVNGTYIATLTLPAIATANYDLIVSSTNGTTTSTSGTLTVIHPISTQGDGVPDNWKLAHNIAINSDPANGPLGDIDKDGHSNLLEYAFNSDPQASESDLARSNAVTKAADGLKYLEVSYPRRIGALDLVYTVEVSDDLTTWPSPGTTSELVSVIANPDGVTETVTVRVLPAMTSAVKKFVRVKVTTQ